MAVAGRVAIVPKGDYDKSLTYKRLDCVKYLNIMYIAKKDVPIGIELTNEEYWMKGVEGGGINIDDSQVSTLTTYSSSKITTLTDELYYNIDTKLGDKLNKSNGDISETIVGIVDIPNVRAIPTIGDKFKTIIGKIIKYFQDLKPVAFTGSYKDLSDTPTIPSVGNGTVTIRQAGTSKGSFTMNQSGDTTIELTDSDTKYTLPSATSSTLGGVKVTDSSAVTNSNGLALAATEKNASISGTLANQISTINNNLAVIGGVSVFTVPLSVKAVAGKETEYVLIDNIPSGTYIISALTHVDNAEIPDGKRLFMAIASRAYVGATAIAGNPKTWQWAQTVFFKGIGCVLRIMSEFDFEAQFNMSVFLMRIK